MPALVYCTSVLACMCELWFQGCRAWLIGNGEYRTLLVSKDGLENAKSLITAYKQGKMPEMNPELWKAKKIVDSTLHPGMK